MMQPYLDGMLSDVEVTEARAHLEACPWCERRFIFEEKLRHFVMVAATEPMSDELRHRLSELRSSQS